MKKTYETPEMNVVALENDAILTSGNQTIGFPVSRGTDGQNVASANDNSTCWRSAARHSMDLQTQSREESSSRQSPHPMYILKNILFQGLALLAVFALAFLIRASAYDLPSVIYADQQYLQDESGNPYLSEMDSYFYLRKAQEMDHGSILINLSGRGDKDMDYIIEKYGIRE